MRIASYEGVELGDELRMASERQFRLHPLLEAGEMLLLEPRRFELRERLLEFRKRRSTPECERLLELLCRLLRVTLSERLPAFVQELFEAAKVERVSLEVDEVAGCA